MFTIVAYITTEDAKFYEQSMTLGYAKTAEKAEKFACDYDTSELPTLPEGQIYDVCVEYPE